MDDHDDLLRDLVARATPLGERLAGAVVPAGGDDELVETRLDGWRRIAARGDARGFARRLRWAGWDEAAVRATLGDVALAADRALPPWAEVVGEIMRAARAASAELDGAAAHLPIVDEPVPFAPVYGPMLAVARRHLAERLAARGADDALAMLAPAARAGLEQALLYRLLALATNVLMAEFDARREAAPAGAYGAFVGELLADGLAALFAEYAVLARLVGTAVLQFADAAAELLAHLRADWAALHDVVLVAPAPPRDGAVTALAWARSDAHNHGRSVAILTLASGARVVYKPKPQRLELAFAELVAFCNARGLPLALRVPRVLHVDANGEHGWCEHVAQRAVDDEAAAARYYRRAGMLSCLLYLLEATDCHHENLIASGEDPILIDLETLLHHLARDFTEQAASDAEQRAGERLMASVLRTSMLPGVVDETRPDADHSGLDGGADGGTYRRDRWLAVNTDEMSLSSEERPLPRMPNRLLVGDVAQTATAFAADVLGGFEAMARLIQRERDALCAPDGPLARFRGEPVRFVFRATRIYSELLAGARAPALLRDGADRSVFLDALSRAFLAPAERPATWPLLAAETDALERLDVPFFTARTDRDAITLPGGAPIAGYFVRPSHDAVLARVRAFDDDDLDRQLRLIRGVLFWRCAADPVPSFDAGEPALGGLASEAPLDRAELIAAACAIADELARHAVRGDDGSATWIGAVRSGRRYGLSVLPDHLGDGSAGVLLFLAALERVTGDDAHRELRDGVARHLRLRLFGPHGPAPDTLRLGGAIGLGSLVYALARAAALAPGGDALLADATAVAAMITDERIAGDRQLDVVGGGAGALLGLLALHRATGDRDVLERARRLGAHLVAASVPSPAGPRAWPTVGGRLLTGFSHGAAGIAYALARLHGVTGDDAPRAASLDGIAYERATRLDERGRWPDLRPGVPAGATGDSWCHGAPGIALARVAGLPACATDEIRDDIAAALDETLAIDVGGVDHLCCGNLGRAEVLLVAAQRLARPDLAAAAARATAWVVRRARRDGAYSLFPEQPRDVYSPGLFQGTTGIGYQLLRQAEPALVPSVLSFD